MASVDHKCRTKDIPLSLTSPEDKSAKQPLQDRRESTPAPAEIILAKHPLLEFFAPIINGFRLQDILNSRQHSADFIETRAEHISVRLRFMAVFYAIAVPLWTPIDYLMLSPEHFSAMILPKALLTAFLLPLGLLTLRKLTSNRVPVIFVLILGVACMFYLSSMLILKQGIAAPPLAGYSFMPFMLVSMLGVFPLTLTSGVALISIIMGVYLGLEASEGQLMTAETANMLWVFFILGGISLWAQSSQLLMLLKLYRESTRDPLTGMINRRVLMKRLTSEIALVSKGRPSFCILMFDLDRFKRINDNYGHLVGDEVLKTTARILHKELREQDIVARFGGEEFVAVLPNSSSWVAIVVAERIRETCYRTQVTAPNGDRIQLSTSVGVTQYEAGEAIEVTLDRADESLYKAKELGRNRVVHSQSEGYAAA